MAATEQMQGRQQQQRCQLQKARCLEGHLQRAGTPATQAGQQQQGH